ncbi:MAG: DNA-binding response regulator [Piscirickettsiaceae bacterium]|nr:MAG: DNA-binding response regulator [Piscirickettsiaceae bacterium]
MQILLVEDDAALIDALQKTLIAEGFAVNCLSKGQQAIVSVKTELPDMVILDLGLPDIDGLDVMRSMRAVSADLPILILTARSSLEDKVTGLDLGADDYLAKPFDVNELLARIRVIERRASSLKHAGLTIGDVTLDTVSHEVTVSDEVASVSRREFMLLKALMENAGRVLTKESLESKLYSWGEEVSSNTIEVHIHNLRKKLPAKFIETLRGVGYIVKLV